MLKLGPLLLRRLLACRWCNFIDFEQANAGCVILARHNGGVVTFGQCGQDSRFHIVGGRSQWFEDTLLGVFPVVVRGEDMAITVYERGFRLTAAQGATRLQPAGRVGPYAPLTKALLFRYQIAV
jgi:hypothetical protein